MDSKDWACLARGAREALSVMVHFNSLRGEDSTAKIMLAAEVDWNAEIGGWITRDIFWMKYDPNVYHTEAILGLFSRGEEGKFFEALMKAYENAHKEALRLEELRKEKKRYDRKT